VTKEVIYIISVTQFHRSVYFSNPIHLPPHIAFSYEEAKKKELLLHQGYEERGINVFIDIKRLATGKKKNIEAINRYREEVGI
jgi:hypothetical protein